VELVGLRREAEKKERRGGRKLPEKVDRGGRRGYVPQEYFDWDG